jgi:teichuronic acid biosynthesis glycosyltransferase TuaG
MLVSVIIPALNSARTLEETIASVQRQTFKHWEMFIVVGRNSKDETFPLAHKWAMRDPRIKAISQESSGVARARNEGIEASSGQYIAFLDADDHWLPLKLERQLAFMRSTGAKFTFTAYRKFFYPGVMGEVKRARPEVDYKMLLTSRPIGLSTVMVERSTGIRFPDVPRNMPEDLAMWLQLTRSGVIARGLDEDLGRYRLGGRSGATHLRVAKNVWPVYRQLERLSLPAAAWYFSQYAINSLRERL